MPDQQTIGVDDRALDDLTLETLAEAYAATPPAALRRRVIATARAEVATAATRRSRTRWLAVGALAATVALALGGLLARERGLRHRELDELASLGRANAELTARLDTQDRTLASLRESLDAQARALRIMGGPRTLSASLGAKEGFSGSGRVQVDAATGEGAVVLADVQALDPNKVYELWALRGDAPPEPAGLLAVSGRAVYLTQVAKLERPTEITAFAVSIEPAGGSKSPTGPIVLVGTVQG